MRENKLEEKNYCDPISEYEGFCLAKDQQYCVHANLIFEEDNICQYCSEKKFLYKNKMRKKCFSLKAIKDQ